MNEDTTQSLPNDGVQLILTRLDSMNSRFDSIDVRFDSIDVRCTSIDVRLDSLDNRLITLEEKVDRRLQETRPIWEQVLVRLDGIKNRLGKLESEVYSLNKKFRLFNEDILKLQNKQEDFEERLDKFDSETTT